MDPIADLPPVTGDQEPHIPHAGNPAPSPAINGAHPPYAEMIMAAIAALKDKDGSSRQAIAKYIEKEYANLPPTHSTLLTHHLKRLKNQGQLMMVKHSYMLPPPRSVPFQPSEHAMDHQITDYSAFPTVSGVNEENSSVIPKRKPGRPPKSRPDYGFQAPDGQPAPEIQPYQPQFEHHLGASGQDLQPHYGSGPEFQGNFAGGAEPIFASLGLADDGVTVPPFPPPENAPTTAKRGRGRPPKGARVSGSVVTTSGGDVTGSGGEAVTGKRGRRRKAGRPRLMSIMMVNGGGAKRAVGRPKRIGMGPVTVPLSGNVSRPRGRPRRDVSRPAMNVSVNGGRGESGLVSRGRGRPPKSAGGLNKISKVGPGTAVLVTDPQQLVVYQELKSKYEQIQSKVKEVLSVVKPYINSDYEAFRALHELEALAGTDVNVQSEKAPASFV